MIHEAVAVKAEFVEHRSRAAHHFPFDEKRAFVHLENTLANF